MPARMARGDGMRSDNTKMKIKRIIKHILIWLPIAFVALSVLQVLVYKWVPVRTTPLMLMREYQNKADSSFCSRREWVEIENISQTMLLATLAQEDALFDKHNGFNLEKIAENIQEHKDTGKRLKGGSTISQQTAKNVFLLPHRNMVRKAFEAYYTLLIEWIWGKERILEVYLNVAEWGPGIYGVQAASKYYYGKDADRLSLMESCMLAACLPMPLRVNPKNVNEEYVQRCIGLRKVLYRYDYPEWIFNL